MAIRIALHHRTEYRFDREVRLAAHSVRLRPARKSDKARAASNKSRCKAGAAKAWVMRPV